ncbi:MAG: hypothetical protein KR126chlam6_00624 [Candidatus Anoxychlamydiales bacterium]|nr:hypothetical protein [Candidatus Anoxychlamydiales bacterium]
MFGKFNSILSERQSLSDQEITLEGLGNEGLRERVKALFQDLMEKNRLSKDKPPATGSLDTLRDALESMTNLGISEEGLAAVGGDDKGGKLASPRSPLLDPHPVGAVVQNGVVKSDSALHAKDSVEASSHRVQIVVIQLLDLLKEHERIKTENNSLRYDLLQMTKKAKVAEKEVKKLKGMLPTRLATIRRSVSASNLRFPIKIQDLTV